MVLPQAHGPHIPFALRCYNAVGVYVWKSYLHKKRNWRRRLAAPHIPSAPRDAYVGELFEEKKVASDRDLRPQTPHSLKNFKVLSLYLLIGSGLFGFWIDGIVNSWSEWDVGPMSLRQYRTVYLQTKKFVHPTKEGSTDFIVLSNTQKRPLGKFLRGYGGTFFKKYPHIRVPWSEWDVGPMSYREYVENCLKRKKS